MTDPVPLRLPPKKIKKLTAGVNDLQTVAPEVAGELISHDPSAVLAGSNMKVRWQCSLCSKEWESSPRSRTAALVRRPGCPTCNRKLALQRRESGTTLRDDAPELYAELVTPDPKLRMSSHREVEWRCAEGHIYLSTANKRASGRPCPYCAWREPLRGFNTLRDVRPDLVASLANPTDANLIANSKTVIEIKHFSKEFGPHVWHTSASALVFKSITCKVCSGKELAVGLNDWQSAIEKNRLSLNWSSKNPEKPHEVRASMHRLFECHEHDTPEVILLQSRQLKNGVTPCRKCLPVRQGASLGEEEVAAFIAEAFPDLKLERNVRRFKKFALYEVDILVENTLAIHYDGTYWHQEGVFKPVGYHADRTNAAERAGLCEFVIPEALWTQDSQAVASELSNILAKL